MSTNFESLLAAFRNFYYQFVNAVPTALINADAVQLGRLGDDMQEYLGALNEVSHSVIYYCQSNSY